MTNDNENADTTGTRLVSRRKTLAAIGTGAGVLSIGAFSGSVAAWKEFDVCFRGCSEVWMVVTEHDLQYDPPAVAEVIVSSGGKVECHEVEFTEANATRIPGQFGDRPVVKYAPGDDYKILGAFEVDYGKRGVWDIHVNQNNCATTPNTPDFHDAPCVGDYQRAYAGDDFCGGTGKGSGRDKGNDHNNGNGNGHGKRGGKGKGRS